MKRVCMGDGGTVDWNNSFYLRQLQQQFWKSINTHPYLAVGINAPQWLAFIFASYGCKLGGQWTPSIFDSLQSLGIHESMWLLNSCRHQPCIRWLVRPWRHMHGSSYCTTIPSSRRREEPIVGDRGIEIGRRVDGLGTFWKKNEKNEWEWGSLGKKFGV